MIGKGFVTQTDFKKHLDGDWRTVHELWSHVRNYMTSYPAPGDTTYTKTEVDAFFEGYSGGKAQVDAGNVVGLTQGSIPFADASGFLTEDNSNLFWDAGNVRLALGHGSPQTILHVLTAGASEIRLETSGAADPQFCLKTTNTAHEVDFALDESAVADHVDFIGQTAGVDTYFHVVGKAGQSAKLGVQIGSYRGELICGSAGHISLKNITADLDLVFGIKDGAVNKTITWDADVDKLKHSAGTFNFDDDHILTTGTINGVILSKETTDNYVFTDALPGAYSGAVGNIAIGKDAGQAVTSGDYNVCIGYEAGMAITTASHNICVGQEAGKRLVGGIRNFFFGYRAGSYCVSGTQNVSMGYDANVTGTSSNNFALGYFALRALTGGQDNVAIGTQALQNAGNTSQNTAIGMAAGLAQNTGNHNVYIGYHAGEQDDGQRNLYIGTSCGVLSGASSYNVALGYRAFLGVLVGTSNFNVSIGYESGYGINAGDNNVFIGAKAGYHVTSGSGNVCIGYMAGETNLTTGSNQLWVANSNTATPLIYGEFDNAYLLINGRLAVAYSTIGDDERGLSSIHTLSDNPAKSDGIGFYSEGHIGAITTDGPTYGAGIWLNIDAGATLGADVRALDIGIYEAGADCSGGNAYGLAIHMEFDDTDPPAAIYAFRINCNDTPGHATPDALIFAPNRSAIALTDAAPGTADAYLKVVLQDGSVYRIPLVKE